jgi:hypothetical protein
MRRLELNWRGGGKVAAAEGNHVAADALCERHDGGGDGVSELVCRGRDRVQEVGNVAVDILGEVRNGEGGRRVGKYKRSGEVGGRHGRRDAEANVVDRGREGTRRHKGGVLSGSPWHTAIGLVPALDSLLQRARRASVTTAIATRHLLANTKVVLNSENTGPVLRSASLARLENSLVRETVRVGELEGAELE